MCNAGSFTDQFFSLFFFCDINLFCFAVAMCNLVQNVKTIFHLCYILTRSEFLSEI